MVFLLFFLKILGDVFLFKHITLSIAASFHDLSKLKLLVVSECKIVIFCNTPSL